MLVRAELVLALVATALALIAITSVLPRRTATWRTPIAVAGCLMAGLAPLLSYPFLDPSRARGRALWEWSAVGGPTVQASYRLDGLAAAGLAIGVLYAAAALVATTRIPYRSSLLRPALLLNAFILITLAVTDDLVAATVVLGALAVTTIFAALLVSPAPAVARLTAYLATGLQAFIVSGLLLARSGAASFRFEALSADMVTPGAVLAATIGGALFAGLYPFVPWGYRQEESGERESIRGLLAMPIGVGALLVVVRLAGATRIELSQLGLPGAVPPALVAIAAAFFLLALWRARQRRPRWRRRLVVSAAILGLLVAYPYLHWSHVVAIACLLSVAYAAAVSLALPDQWPVTRYDVTLAAAWIGLATGTPVALAGALAVLAGGALAAVTEAFWMPPHRGYIAMLASTATIVAGALAIGLGAFAATDYVTVALTLVAIVFVIALELVHVGRRLEAARAPADLEASATVVALLAAAMVAIVAAPAMLAALAGPFGRPVIARYDEAAYAVAALAILAAILSVVAGAVRPALPDMAPIGERLAQIVAIADPVPVAANAFRLLERSATAVSTAFAIFEHRAGVWLAIVLIAGVLLWSVR